MQRVLKIILLLASLVSISAYAQVSSLFHQAGDPIAGNPRGNITVVEFFDYQCSHCVDMAPIISNIIRSNPNVKFVFKDFPIRGPMSQYAARAALAANKQGKYYEFSHALLSTNLPLDENTIMQIAITSGVDVSKLKKDMSNKSIYNQLNSTVQLAGNLNVRGTPVFFIGKSNAKNLNDVIYIPGAVSQSELQRAIDSVK